MTGYATRYTSVSAFIAMFLFLASCASQDPQMQPLLAKNQELEQQLIVANNEIRKLKQTEQQLRDSIGELRQTANVLTTEKTSRIQESSSLRGQVRKFIQDNIDDMKLFMVRGNILDYVGGELVPRSKIDTGSIFIVDFANVMPSAGLLTGVGGNFTQPGTFIVKVLHPVQGQHVVTWESKPISVSSVGKQQIQFPVSVGVEKGDVIGYFFPQAPNVGYDISTGETLYSKNDVPLGSTVSKTLMSGGSNGGYDQGERRAYSLGVYGLLDSNN